MVELLESVTRGAKSFAMTGADLTVGALGVGTGLVAGKFIGKTVEDALVTSVTEASTSTQKLTAYLANNLPKVASAFAIAYAIEPKMPAGYISGIVSGIKYGLMGDVAIDSLARFTHKGVPTVYLGKNPAADTRIQALLQENSQLKLAIQRLNQEGSKLRQATGKQNVPIVKVEQIRDARLEAPPNRPLEKKYEFAPGAAPGPGDVYAKRPLEKKYQFTEGNRSVTNPETLVSGFGFLA